MSVQNTAARELRSFSHQVVKGAFALTANDGSVVEIDDQFAFREPFSRVRPRALQFREPGLNEFSLDYQATLRLGIDRRNLQHCCIATKREGQYGSQSQSGFRFSQVIEVYKGREEPRKIMSRTVEVNFDTCRGQRQLQLVRKVEEQDKQS
jgi:hypothetical protein